MYRADTKNSCTVWLVDERSARRADAASTCCGCSTSGPSPLLRRRRRAMYTVAAGPRRAGLHLGAAAG
ncbi:hypothetical protein ACU686_14300 [Yinghuangia aomiensis]